VPRETSAGVLVYRFREGGPEFLLVHPGGPYWAKKDEAGWSIPKGLVAEGEQTWAAAQREFAEELGQPIVPASGSQPVPLTPCPTPGGKLILAWLVEADLDLTALRSNAFEIEWPPRVPAAGPAFRRSTGPPISIPRPRSGGCTRARGRSSRKRRRGLRPE
jgi:predicted NUDIX family NTP pyrophosphohydrolase